MENTEKSVRILSLDCGGPGSYSQLLIIREFMNRIAYEQDEDLDNIYPADFFDMIGGTGFGAYISILLGVLRLTIDRAIEELHFSIVLKKMEDLIERYQLPTSIKLSDKQLHSSGCKVVLFATSTANVASCQAFRTYRSSQATIDCSLLDALCASMAIPSICDPVHIGNRLRQQAFIGGASGFTNPTHEIIAEAKSAFRNETWLALLLSLGMGRPGIFSLDMPTIDASSQFESVLSRMALDCETVAQSLADQLLEVDAYVWLNVDQGLEDLKVDDWSDLGTIETHTTAYLDDTFVNKVVSAGSQKLVNRVGALTLGQLSGSTQFISTKPITKKAPAVSPFFVVQQKQWMAMTELLLPVSPDHRKIFVITGMGGCGKMQMISYFVEKYQTHYSQVIFIDGTSRSSISSDLQASVCAIDGNNQQYTDAQALAYLAQRSHSGNWLLIIDNADDPDLDLTPFIPSSSHGTIIITSRICDHGYLSPTAHLELGAMQEKEAIETLCHASRPRLPLSLSDEEDARELVVELGQYTSLFRAHGSGLLRTKRPMTLDRYPHGVYTALDLSYSRLSDASRRLWHLLSFFHYTNIPSLRLLDAIRGGLGEYIYLQRPPEHSMVVARLKQLFCTNGRWDELKFQEMLRELSSASLLYISPSRGLVFLRLHRLVHAYARETLEESEKEMYKSMVLRVIGSSYRATIPSAQQHIVPHTLFLYGLDGIEAIHINDLMAVGEIINDFGRSRRAEKAFDRAVSILKENSGEHHENTIRATCYLASSLSFQGRWREVEALQAKVLEMRKEILGRDHPHTISASLSLAWTFGKLGRWKEAEALQVKLLEMRETVSGKEHPDTLEALANLAWTLGNLGKWKNAAELQTKVLEMRERTLGSDHSCTLSASADLVWTLGQLGMWNKAKERQDNVVERMKHILGDEHPRTLFASHHLALTLGRLGRWNEAEEMQVKVSKEMAKILGDDHPSMLIVLADLAWTLGKLERWQDAEELQLNVLDKGQKVIGSEHPHTLTTSSNLAWTMAKLGRCEEAKIQQSK
ncbi:hypothetical protein CPB86DRAFT_787723, partial [Serendipita vermifera]